MHKSPSSLFLEARASSHISFNSSKWVPRGNGLAVALIQKICATLVTCLGFQCKQSRQQNSRFALTTFEIKFLHLKENCRLIFQCLSNSKAVFYLLLLLGRWRRWRLALLQRFTCITNNIFHAVLNSYLKSHDILYLWISLKF